MLTEEKRLKCCIDGCDNPRMFSGKRSKLGFKIYKTYCSSHCKKFFRTKHKYKAHKKDFCEQCGFMGHPCQLDVDHIDQDHLNASISNLQTLCANCHRLKTYKDRKKQTIY